MNPRVKYYFLYRLYTIYILYAIFPLLKFTGLITTFKCLGDFLYDSKTVSQFPLSQVIPIIMSMISFVKLLRKQG